MSDRQAVIEPAAAPLDPSPTGAGGAFGAVLAGVQSIDRGLRRVLGERAPYRVAFVGLCLLGWAFLPLSLIGTVDVGLVYGIGAIALNLVTGVAGMPSIGNAAFLAVGAFAVALVPGAKNDFYLGLLVATVVATVVGGIVGLTALRVRGLYLAVGTLALQFIIADGGTLWEQHTQQLGGYEIPTPEVLPGVHLESFQAWFIVLAIALGVSALVGSNLLRSRWGRGWLAIRENDVIARNLGVNVRLQKLIVFSASSGMIGLAGGLLAYYTTNVDADSFTLTLAIQFVAIIIIGGFGSIPGSIAGTAVVVAIPVLLQHIGGAGGTSTGWWAQNTFNVQSGIFGIVIILVLFTAPEGLASLGRKLIRA